MDLRKVLAELAGTLLFMTIGYLSVAAIGASGAPGLLVVPFSFGFGLLAAIFAFGHISGGHFNPAVTIAMLVDRRIGPADAIGYIVAQVVGAVGAGVFVLLVFDAGAVAAGITQPGGGVTEIGALLIEVALAAAFLAVILTSTRRAPSFAPLVIPLTLVAIHFASAPLSGASVNPARSIGSALVGGDLSVLWVYLVGPIAGGLLGWAVYRGVDGGAEEAT